MLIGPVDDEEISVRVQAELVSEIAARREIGAMLHPCDVWN